MGLNPNFGGKNFTTWVRSVINAALQPFNLEVATLTRIKREQDRIQKLAKNGYFERHVFPVPTTMANSSYKQIIDIVNESKEALASLENVGYFNNEYTFSPVGEAQYAEHQAQTCRL